MKDINDYSWLEERILRHEAKKAALAATYGMGTGRLAEQQVIARKLNGPLPIHLTGTPMKQFGKPAEPEARAMQMNSITKLEALVPVRVATSKVLEGTWVGPALDEARVVGSLFGGAHYILQLGYNQVVGHAASFRLVFVAHMPVEKGTVLTHPVVIEDAQQTANAFLMMLNLRRVAGANATQTKQNAAGATLVSSFQGSGSAIPGKPLTGKRADVLIVDDLQYPPLPEEPSKPYVAKLGKRPV